MMRSLGYAEVAIVVADVDRAADFYVDVVGYEQAEIDVGPGGRIMKISPGRMIRAEKRKYQARLPTISSMVTPLLPPSERYVGAPLE